jgi:hypothetical protein
MADLVRLSRKVSEEILLRIHFQKLDSGQVCGR